MNHAILSIDPSDEAWSDHLKDTEWVDVLRSQSKDLINRLIVLLLQAEDEDLWSHLSTATSTYEEKATTYDSFMIEKLAKMARKQPEKLSITSSSQYEPELAPISPSPRLSSTPYTYSNPSSIGYGRTMDYGLMGYGRNSPFMDYGSSYGERSMGYGRNNFGGLGFGTGGLFGISSGIGVTAPFVGPIGVGSGLTIG